MATVDFTHAVVALSFHRSLSASTGSTDLRNRLRKGALWRLDKEGLSKRDNLRVRAVLENPKPVNGQAEISVRRIAELLKESPTSQVLAGRKKPATKQDAFPSLQAILNAAKSVNERLLSSIIERLYVPSDEVNYSFHGNFGPVQEIGSKRKVSVTSGAIPEDFPAGIYLRCGSNPQFGGKYMNSPFGKAGYHWFEGDGMMHATYFEKDHSVFYHNKYVETDSYRLEKERGRPVYLTTVEGTHGVLRMNILLNILRFGKPTKSTCNTTVFEHAGRIYANAEVARPCEINPSNLRTISEDHDFNGAWRRPFGSHPKADVDTNEMVIYGFDGAKPYLVVGVVGADGKTLKHQVDIGLERPIITHDVQITERYNVVMDFPLCIELESVMKGGSLLNFHRELPARIGVFPRYGDKESIQWFSVRNCYMFHSLNCYEEGDEVVLHGLPTRVPLLPTRWDMDRMEWYSRGITPCREEDAVDPHIDGALFSCLHEWRLNTKTGAVVERDLTDDSFTMEYPDYNNNYTGKKYKYGYAACLDIEASKIAGMPKFNKIVKLDVSVCDAGRKDGRSPLATAEFHDLGPSRFAGEPQFVGRPGSTAEDDGWIVTYVHDESTNISEVVIIDAQKIMEAPLARIELPQRVPYGFHSTYVYSIE